LFQGLFPRVMISSISPKFADSKCILNAIYFKSNVDCRNYSSSLCSSLYSMGILYL
jgi:hypothetical protein